MGQKKLESQEAGNTFPGDLFTLFENPIARSFGRQYLLHFFFIPLQFDEGSPWPSGECPGELSIYCEEVKEPGGETFLFSLFPFPLRGVFSGRHTQPFGWEERALSLSPFIQGNEWEIRVCVISFSPTNFSLFPLPWCTGWWEEKVCGEISSLLFSLLPPP